MREHRLLDRIRHMGKNPHRGVTQDPQQMIHSIQQHLQRILNTRMGSALIAEDYGVPDFTNFMSTFPDSQRGIERSLRQTIQKYEPRLQGVRVTFFPRKEDDPLSISLQITARLVSKGHKESVLFTSVVDADGRIRMQE
jgi:type VI secretion system protein